MKGVSFSQTLQKNCIENKSLNSGDNFSYVVQKLIIFICNEKSNKICTNIDGKDEKKFYQYFCFMSDRYSIYILPIFEHYF